MTRSATRTFALVTALAFAACGDSGTSPDGDALSETEAAALSSVIVSQAFTTGFTAMAGAFGAVGVEGPSAVVPFQESVSGTEPCALGGTVDYQGTISGDTGTSSGGASARYLSTVTHNSCQLQGTTGSFIISGSPNLAISLDLELNSDFSATFTGSFTGGSSWILGGRAGNCIMDVSFSGTTTGEVTVSGTACGVSISS